MDDRGKTGETRRLAHAASWLWVVTSVRRVRATCATLTPAKENKKPGVRGGERLEERCWKSQIGGATAPARRQRSAHAATTDARRWRTHNAHARADIPSHTGEHAAVEDEKRRCVEKWTREGFGPA